MHLLEREVDVRRELRARLVGAAPAHGRATRCEATDVICTLFFDPPLAEDDESPRDSKWLQRSHSETLLETGSLLETRQQDGR